MRINKAELQSQLLELNRTLNRPEEMFASKVGEPVRFNVGHLSLDKNSFGWQLEEHTGDGGGTRPLTKRMSAKDISSFMIGMMHGIRLQKQQIS